MLIWNVNNVVLFGRWNLWNRFWNNFRIWFIFFLWFNALISSILTNLQKLTVRSVYNAMPKKANKDLVTLTATWNDTVDCGVDDSRFFPALFKNIFLNLAENSMMILSLSWNNKNVPRFIHFDFGDGNIDGGYFKCF